MPNLTVKPLTLPLVAHPESDQLLYHHQAAMLDAWEEHDSFVVVSKTGTGKTIAAILPVIRRRQRAICVYPTNELVRDQVRNIRSIAEREKLSVCVQTPGTSAEEYSKADLILVFIDANALEDWCRKKRYRAKWQALRELLTGDKPKIVLTNPDILFLIFALTCHSEALAALQAYDALIVDEFHLYAGVELAHALYMLHVGRSLGTFRKVVLLSATPPPGVQEHINHLLEGPLTFDSATDCARRTIGKRQAVQQIEIVPHLARQDVVETAVEILNQLAAEIRDRRGQNTEPDYVPAVVVLDSVVDAIRLEDRLVEAGFQRDDIAIIRGLSSREIRSTSDKLLAVGTSAIEVGVDFRCDYLIFEANEAGSFMQRFGRVGRHSPGKAIVLCEANVLKGLESLPREVERGELEDRVYAWYRNRQMYEWFPISFAGLLSALTLTERLIEQLRQNGSAREEQISEARTRMDEIAQSYAVLLGCEDRTLTRVTSQIRRMRRGDDRYQWIATYRDLNTFRTSLPSEWVLDFAEKDRRGGNWTTGKYTVDFATLMRRAEGLRYNEKIPHPDGTLGMLTVKGYGRYKRVYIARTFTDDECGIVFRTGELSEHLLIMQEGHKTSVSHVMNLRDHIFVVVPKEMALDLDWRLPVFDCGKHIVAFDGAALLLHEIYWRSLR